MRTVLISGMGIAGPTLAHWLLRRGFVPTLLERAAAFRSGGYVMDFWGLGFEVAERMGLLPGVRRHGYSVREVRLVGNRGQRVGGFGVDSFRRALDGRFVSILRGDLALEIFRTVSDRMELLFGNEIRALAQSGNGVEVEFERGGCRRFDLVVGADGLHSRLRRLVFPDGVRERYLGYCAAAFTAPDYPHRDIDTYVSHAVPGRQIARLSLRDGATVFFLIFASPQQPQIAHGDTRAQKALLRSAYAGTRWEWGQIAACLEASSDLYFDTVSQIRIERWHQGRVALLGDAAACPSLLAGEGASLAMAAAYVMAGELARSPEDVDRALARYQRQLDGLYRAKQDAAAKFAGWFAPRTRAGLALRNVASRLLSVPVVGDALARRMARDPIELPRYDELTRTESASQKLVR